MVKISVVMAVYNAGAALRETLDSILAQTETDFEIIAVDDGSAVADAAILDGYAARDTRLKILRRGRNLGLTHSLIEGCAAAQGVYICRHDAGDTSHPRRLEIQLQMLEKTPDVTFVSAATEYIGPEGEHLWVTRTTGASVNPAEIVSDREPGLLTDGPSHHGSVMFRRDAYEKAGGYRAQFYYGQDFDLWFRLALLGRFQMSEEVLYTARITPGSISATARIEQQRLSQLSRAACEARRRGQPEDAFLAEAAAIGRVRRRSSPGADLYFIGEALRRNGNRRALHYFVQSLRANPFAPRTLIRYLQSLLL